MLPATRREGEEEPAVGLSGRGWGEMDGRQRGRRRGAGGGAIMDLDRGEGGVEELSVGGGSLDLSVSGVSCFRVARLQSDYGPESPLGLTPHFR